MLAEWMLDILLGLALLWLGVYALLARSSRDAIIGFIAFGMLMALAWLRLGSTDLAIAEAALGGGITGALLLSAQRKLEEAVTTVSEKSVLGKLQLWGITLLALCLTLLLALSLMDIPASSSGLSEAVSSNLANSGVSAEVTAVLLNFRGYDTMLEVSVLLAALLGVWHLGVFQAPQHEDIINPILESLVRFVVPIMVVVTGYVLWLGSHSAGGAFQAGALLAAAGVLMLVANSKSLPLKDHFSLRLLIIAGPAIFTLLALWMAWSEGSLVQYPRQHAGKLILVIEMASTFSIGISLLLLFAGGRPHKGGDQ